jgi:hypothetical protein
MAIPNGTSGYQVGAGNVGEPLIFPQGAPTALTAGATATPAELANGLFTFNGTAGNLVLPTVALWEAHGLDACGRGRGFGGYVGPLPLPQDRRQCLDCLPHFVMANAPYG